MRPHPNGYWKRQLKANQEFEITIVAKADVLKLEIETGYLPKNENHGNSKTVENSPVVTVKWRALNRKQKWIHTCLRFSIDI